MAVHAALDEAVLAAYRLEAPPELRVEALRRPLEAVVAEGAIPIQQYSERSRERYARYLLSDPAAPFHIVLAFWRPGADSPIHDHGGLTGAVVAFGEGLSEEKFELVATEGRYAISKRRSAEMRPGKLSPIYPRGIEQVHRMNNLGETTVASLHVYLGRLERINRYLPSGGGVFRQEARDLWFDGD